MLSGSDGTGARGGGGCSCHNAVEDTSLTLSIVVDSEGVAVDHYIPGLKYRIKLTAVNRSATMLPKYGFRMATIATANAGKPNAENTGAFSTENLSENAQITSLSSFNILEHKLPVNATMGNGGEGTIYEQSVTWTAPAEAEAKGDLSIFAVLLAANGDGKQGGDKWKKQMITLSAWKIPLKITAATKRVCVGSDFTFKANKAGGFWSSSNPRIANIGTNFGELHAEAPGEVVITYTVNSEMRDSVRLLVEPKLTDVSNIVGPLRACEGIPMQYEQDYHHGSWSVDNDNIATIDQSGLFMGLGEGVATISYSVSGACGSLTKTKTVKIYSSPFAGSIYAPESDWCVGTPVSLITTGDSGGAWSTTNDVAYITGSGVVIGQHPGTDTVVYSVKKGICLTQSTLSVTYHPKPDPGMITRAWGVKANNRIQLRSGVEGGKWSVDNATCAIGPDGEVIGLSKGTAVVSYTVSNGQCVSTASSTLEVFGKYKKRHHKHAVQMIDSVVLHP
ncbi:MAG: hypothetical protein EBX41_04795 [Chitinophagia bacterium]|nr:hypothetical protein [Chitinophagia bacterium]